MICSSVISMYLEVTKMYYFYSLYKVPCSETWLIGQQRIRKIGYSETKKKFNIIAECMH